MANEALINQQLLDQMFARSVAPLSTGLEQARLRMEKERELATEMNFRREMADRQFSAQAQQAKDQQAAILARELALQSSAQRLAELDRLRKSTMFSEEELSKAASDDVYRSKLLNTVDSKVSQREEEGFGVLSEEKDRLTRALSYELENGSKTLGREAKSLAVTEFLQSLDEDSRIRVMKALGRAGKQPEDLTPETLDAIMQADPGLFGSKRFGFSDSERIDALLAFKSSLDKAAVASKQAPLGALQTMQKIQALDATIAKRADQFPTAYTNFLKTSAATAKQRAADISASLGGADGGWGTTNVFQGNASPAPASAAEQALAGAAAFNQPVTTQPAAENYGGAIGLLGRGVSAVGKLPGYIDEKDRALTGWVAGLIGGDKLQRQVEGAYAQRIAEEEAALRRLAEIRAAQEKVNPELWNFAPF